MKGKSHPSYRDDHRRPSKEIDNLLRSDLEQEALTDQQRENWAYSVLEELEKFLENADRTLEDIDGDNRLGSAIIRTTQNLADAIGNLAEQLDHQTETERKALAQACLNDVSSLQQLKLAEVEDGERPDEWEDLNNMSEGEMAQAIGVAASLLRDVEATLRAIERDEADEIADVTLTVARLFIASLQSFVSTVSPEDWLRGVPEQSSRPTIEIIDEDYSSSETTSQREISASSKTAKRRKKKDRVRVLWPPLGPAVANFFDWGKTAAKDRPLLAVALGITLWPTAVIATVFGGPMVLMDGFVQDLYKNFEDAPMIVGLERGVAQLYHTTRLMVVSGKLVGRQSVRFLTRQVNRHGGVGQIAKNAGGFALDRITHPLETLGMACNSVAWGAGAVRDFWKDIHDEERNAAVQELQQ